MKKIIPLAMALCACACSDKDQKQIPADALVTIDGYALTASELDANMPGGLSEADSAKLAQAYIKSWIDAQLISRIAAEDIDMAEINKMVDQYRRQLIMQEYTRRMYDEKGSFPISEDTIQAYYDANKAEFKLKRPLVKGVYLKVADDSPSLPQLRKLYRSKKDADIDKLDKSLLNGTIHYDYFRDKWIDWEQIESRVPYDFGVSADAFLRSHGNLDISVDGFTYLLDISDALYTGQNMPYEAAEPLIKERLQFYNRRNYQEQLKQNLYTRAIEQGRLEIKQ